MGHSCPGGQRRRFREPEPHFPSLLSVHVTPRERQRQQEMTKCTAVTRPLCSRGGSSPAPHFLLRVCGALRREYSVRQHHHGTRKSRCSVADERGVLCGVARVGTRPRACHAGRGTGRAGARTGGGRERGRAEGRTGGGIVRAAVWVSHLRLVTHGCVLDLEGSRLWKRVGDGSSESTETVRLDPARVLD